MSDFPHVLENLLDSEQAAAIVKVHPKTLQRYARNGLVIGLRVGKLWRFRASDLFSPLISGKDHLDDDDRTR
jgi:phage terminase Nu1 subunit (DNA packaging protein)